MRKKKSVCGYLSERTFLMLIVFKEFLHHRHHCDVFNCSLVLFLIGRFKNINSSRYRITAAPFSNY